VQPQPEALAAPDCSPKTPAAVQHFSPRPSDQPLSGQANSPQSLCPGQSAEDKSRNSVRRWPQSQPGCPEGGQGDVSVVGGGAPPPVDQGVFGRGQDQGTASNASPSQEEMPSEYFLTTTI